MTNIKNNTIIFAGNSNDSPTNHKVNKSNDFPSNHKTNKSYSPSNKAITTDYKGSFAPDMKKVHEEINDTDLWQKQANDKLNDLHNKLKIKDFG